MLRCQSSKTDVTGEGVTVSRVQKEQGQKDRGERGRSGKKKLLSLHFDSLIGFTYNLCYFLHKCLHITEHKEFMWPV